MVFLSWLDLKNPFLSLVLDAPAFSQIGSGAHLGIFDGEGRKEKLAQSLPVEIGRHARVQGDGGAIQ